MDNLKLTGRIIDCGNGCEASLIIPVGDYRIMILNDDGNGIGKGKILRSELKVYDKDDKPSNSINEMIFGEDFVIADSDTLYTAMQFLQQFTGNQQ